MATKQPKTGAEKNKSPAIKAVVVGSTSNAESSVLETVNAALGGTRSLHGILPPPYDPQQLIKVCERSSVLPQHIEAIVTNVDAYGHKLTPSIDLTAADVEEKVSLAIVTANADDADVTGADVPDPTPEEVQTKIKQLKRQAAIEQNRAETFFSSCCPDYSFIQLRTELRTDQLTTGNAYVEVMRDTRSRPARLVRAPSINMRLMARDSTATRVKVWTRVSPIEWVQIEQEKFFRRFAEVSPEGDRVKVYFKEYGDPRVVSRMTGKVYNTLEEFQADPNRKEGDQPANEIIHLSLMNLAGPYGVPSWIGNLPAVLGSRELDEVNLAYFENKTVPPLALLVNGGRLSKGVVPRIEEFVEQQVKGKKNFHKILIIEAEGQKGVAGTNGIVPTLKFEHLRESQQQDALFQNYDERNWDKIASSFRLPRILVGRDRAINRATAIAAIRFAEEQVFEPIRNRFDEYINQRILPEIGVFFWQFRSNTPITRDPEMLADIIATLSEVGVITPREARVFAGDVFNTTLVVTDDPWMQKPLKLTLAEKQSKKDGEKKTSRVRAKQKQLDDEAEKAEAATAEGSKAKAA